MGQLGYIVLGLALIVGALAFAGHRHLPSSTTASKPTAPRSVAAPPPSSSRTSNGTSTSVSGLQLFDMGLNVANVVVGILGIWMTMRGMRAERRANAMAMRRDR